MTGNTYNLIYSKERRHRIKRHLLFWLTCLVFFTLIYGSMRAGTGSLPPAHYFFFKAYLVAFVQAIIFLPLHIFLSYTIMYLLVPRYFFKEKYQQLVFWVLLSFLCTGVFSHVLSVWVVGPAVGLLGVNNIKSEFALGLMAGLRGGLTVSGFAVAIKLGKYWYHKNQLNKQLEAEKLKAELQVLRAQVHPHFLFNTLNNLYSLALQQSSETPEVVLKLSGLLRYMLYDCNVSKVPLRMELQLMYDYIELEKLRYGNRLDFSIDIEGDPAGIMIAPLLLLPFLENSFKHGASEQLDQAWISLALRVRQHELRMKLMNGIVKNTAPQSAHGIGLQNVQKRLKLLYPDRHELKLIREDELFIVSLNIQLEEAPAAALPEVPVPAVNNSIPKMEASTHV
ncbi:putative signal transduction histidine kinase [Flammeovirgaceae bacterium 311]|nr:putative signal transduction histidine kinase [Flammeovirgaceae bacterium 311]